jgi:hypothetical protein
MEAIMRKWLAITAFFFCLTLLFSGISSSANSEFEDPGQQLAFIPGQILRAYLAAYEDFGKRLKEYSQNPNKTAQICSKMENYNVEVFEKGNAYLIYFSLNHRKFLWIRGGGAEYKIDKNTYAIVDKKYWR